MTEAFSPGDLLNGWIDVGLVATPIVDSPTRFYSGVLFYNASDSAVICIGTNPNTTADPSHKACGMPIAPHASVVIPVRDLSRLFATATDVPAKLFYFGA